MKKFLILSLVSVFLLGMYETTNAQMFRQSNGEGIVSYQYGVIGGLNFADFMGKGISNTETRLTGNGGIFAAIQIGNYFAVQPEALISFRGAQEKLTPGGKLRYRLSYIQVPVLAKGRYELDNGLTPYVFAGPSIAFMVGDKYKYTGNYTGTNPKTGNLKDIGYRTNDTLFDLNFGAGLQFGRIMLEGRYQWGLTDVFKNMDTQHSVFKINVGIGLNPVTR